MGVHSASDNLPLPCHADTAFLSRRWVGTTSRDGGQNSQDADKAPIRSRPPDRLVHAPDQGLDRQFTKQGTGPVTRFESDPTLIQGLHQYESYTLLPPWSRARHRQAPSEPVPAPPAGDDRPPAGLADGRPRASEQSWRLDEQTRRAGRRGVALARLALATAVRPADERQANAA
jgi:hypothetical protein